jgi:hypothetical protein
MRLTPLSHVSLIALAGVVLSAAFVEADPPAPGDNIRITIVPILASDKHRDVDPKLKEIAREVQKREAALTGFRLGPPRCKPVAIGQKENFKLTGDDDGPSADVTVLQKDDTQQRIRLAVKAPQVGEITYSTSYEKYFPILTRVITKDGQRLILAIMVKQAGKDAKDGK